MLAPVSRLERGKDIKTGVGEESDDRRRTFQSLSPLHFKYINSSAFFPSKALLYLTQLSISQISPLLLMESTAVLRSFHHIMSPLKSIIDKPGVFSMNNADFSSFSKYHVQRLTYGGKLVSYPNKLGGAILSCVKASEAPVTAKSDYLGDSNGAVLSDSFQKGSGPKNSIRRATFPNGFEALVTEVCDDTEVAELKVKVGDFEMRLKRNIEPPKSPAPVESPTVAPPIPSKPMNESSPVPALPALPKPSAEKVSPFINVPLIFAVAISETISDTGGETGYPIFLSYFPLYSIPFPRKLTTQKFREGMASPPTLPISNPQSTATAAQSQPPIATPAFRSFINRLSASVRQGFSQRRPWSELLDRTAFSRPDSLSEAASRIRKNFNYFRVNYISLLAFVLALSLLSHPFSLLVLLALLASWCFVYLFRPSDQPLVIFGRTFSDRETLLILVVSTIVVVFLTTVGSLLISASLVGLAIICAHGAFRIPEDLFLDDQEPANAGFLSFLGGAASSAAAAAAPAVAARV